MATSVIDGPPPETVADLLKRLGNIPASRIRIDPPPGTAREKDVVAAMEEPRKRICELVNGVLVEKAMEILESLFAIGIATRLSSFVAKNDLGIVLGADGAYRLMPGLVRIPDISFVSWQNLPGEEVPKEPIPDLAPDLAVEVVSKGNTPKEMARKLKEYFEVGVKMVWLIQPKTQTAEIYTSPTNCRTIGRNGTLDAGQLLPGFSLPLKKIFERTKRRRSGR